MAAPPLHLGCGGSIARPPETLQFMKETEIIHSGRTNLLTTLNAKKRTRIGCWNVRTLLEASRLNQVDKEMSQYNIKVLGLSEVRWPDNGEFTLANGDLFLFSGKPRDANHESGVGILINKGFKSSLLQCQPISDRIITAKFHTRIRTFNLIQCYVPTEKASQEDKDMFYDTLSATIATLKRGDINVLMGDLRSQVGNDNTGYERNMGKHGLGEMNDNGSCLADFCAENHLVLGGTVFPHKDCHKVTWVSPNRKYENQIDHFCINKKWRRTMEDVRNKGGADVGSDYHLLIAELKIKVAKAASKYKTTQKRYNVDRLHFPPTKIRFEKELKNQYQRLTYSDQDTINTKWQAIKTIITIQANVS